MPDTCTTKCLNEVRDDYRRQKIETAAPIRAFVSDLLRELFEELLVSVA